MGQLRRLLFLAVAGALAGCGGGGGGVHDDSVSGTQFRIAWPARTRAAMQIGLTSAQSARVVVQDAGASQSDVTVNVDRDPTRLEAYTATYTVPQPISPSHLGNLNATFFSLPSQGGTVVGTATATATLVGTNVEFANINVTGTITQVAATPATLSVTSGPTQLEFTTKNSANEVVAVTPGSATWTVEDGSAFVSVTPDGIATPLGAGTAHVRVSVDGVTSALAAVTVEVPDVPVFSWAGAKGGTMTTPTFDAVEGNKFRIAGGKNVIVTKLGVEAKSASQPAMVTAIFDQNGTVLASATVSTTDSLENGYYYKEIAPLTLTSGSNYYIGSLHLTGASWAYLHNTNTASVPSFITDLSTCFKVSSTIQGGTWSTPGPPRHYVGNFQAYQVP